MSAPLWWYELFAFLLGTCVGSFLNVVIHRLPMNQSVVSPGSHCPECGAPIRAADNIPLISWLLLFGLCRDCGATISPRYLFVELLTGALTWAVVHRFGPSVSTAFYILLVWALIAIAFIDLQYQIIPDEISIGAVVVGLAASFFMPVGFPGALYGLALGGGIFFALAIVYPGGLGGGDIKLMAAVGAFIGWKLTLLTIFIGSFTGSVVGLSQIAFFGKTRKSRIPFGPFLAAGAVISLLFGDWMIAAYLASFL